MKSIDLKSFLNMLIEELLSNSKDEKYKNAYLRDGDGNYHTISHVDIMRDRITCEDGYWDCYEWIADSEDRLYVEE